MGMNALIAAINKYGFGRYTHNQVQCNYLVQAALTAAGYNIGPFNTNDIGSDHAPHALFKQADGTITDLCKAVFRRSRCGLVSTR